jgi:hypothetical protein
MSLIVDQEILGTGGEAERRSAEGLVTRDLPRLSGRLHGWWNGLGIWGLVAIPARGGNVAAYAANIRALRNAAQAGA